MAEFLTEQKLVPPTIAPSSVSSPPVAKSNDKRYVLGVSCFYHNSSAALISDGKLVAAADEERFTRVKNDRRFPQLAINYCLEEAGISAEDLAAVAFYDNSGLTFERILQGIMAIDQPAAERMCREQFPNGHA